MLAILIHTVTRILVYSLVSLLGLWCWFQWKKWDYLQVARKLPCTVKPLPILGHAHLLLKGWEGFTTYILEMLPLKAVNTGLYNVCFWCGPLPFVVVHKLEDVQKLLTTSGSAEKAQEYDYLKYAAGNGLLTAPGHIWKITRRHISPLFNRLNIEQLMVVFNNNSRELVADLAEHVDGEPVDIIDPAMSISLKTVCQLIFGTEIDFDRNSKAFGGLMKVVEEVLLVWAKRGATPWLRVDFIFKFLYREKLREINKLWKDFTQSPLKIAKQNYTNKRNGNLSSSEDNKSSTQEGSITLIDIYEELQKKYPQFTENDLKSEMFTLYFTGTDTVGLVVTSCLLALSKYQDIQDRVYDEINAVVGPDDDVTMDHISRMQYLDQVYKETLRWSIVVPYLLRRTTEDVQLSDCTLPAGNTVAIGLVGPHMDPKIYPNPKQFDPDRFSPENSAMRPKNAFIPFSIGSRMCIGKFYSEHLVKTMLVHVLRRYRMSTDMDILNLRKCYMITLINADGYPIRFVNRN